MGWFGCQVCLWLSLDVVLDPAHLGQMLLVMPNLMQRSPTLQGQHRWLCGDSVLVYGFVLSTPKAAFIMLLALVLQNHSGIYIFYRSLFQIKYRTAPRLVHLCGIVGTLI